MIFISNSFFIYPIAMTTEGVRHSKLFALAIVFMYFIIAAVLYFDILSIVAFFKFVINDKLNTKFAHFYVNNMYYLTFILAGLQVGFLPSFLGTSGSNSAEANLVVSLHVFIALSLLTLIFFWSRRLLNSLPKVEESNEAARPIDEESNSENEHKNKAAENVEPPKN